MDIFVTSQFKKDVKNAKKRGKDSEKLKEVMSLIEKGHLLPPKYRNHRLLGNYKDCWECHIEPDWLLIYKKDKSSLTYIRTCSHSDLMR